jgi:hypothetical protein
MVLKGIYSMAGVINILNVSATYVCKGYNINKLVIMVTFKINLRA